MTPDQASLICETMQVLSCTYWAQVNNLVVDNRLFSIYKHPFQADILDSKARVMVCRKGAQLGLTTTHLIKTVHGMVVGRYPSGALYLFPTDRDVSDFSRVRLNPLLASNPLLMGLVEDTDSVELKKIGNATFYLRGARSRSRLKSIPVDRIVFDEVDEMDPSKVELAKQRLAHSLIKEEVYLSTPTIPDYGVDALFQKSTKNHWFITCGRCGKETCLELEFPNCITEDGRRLCVHCREEIDPLNGRWLQLGPDSEIEGWYISQLSSVYVNPAVILDEYLNPPRGKLQEVYNSRLGLPYIDAKQRLTVQDVYDCCDNYPEPGWSKGPCAMGVDVGDLLHIVIGIRTGDRSYKILKLHRTSEWNDIHDLAELFNVVYCVIDMRPEVRKVRDLQESEEIPVYGCVYRDFRLGGPTWDDDRMQVFVGRTEWLDAVHDVFAETRIILPRRSTIVELYAKQMTNTAKVFEEKEETGEVKPVYYRLSDDHFYHATGYFLLACERTPVVRSATGTWRTASTSLVPEVMLV